MFQCAFDSKHKGTILTVVSEQEEASSGLQVCRRCAKILILGGFNLYDDETLEPYTEEVE